MKLEWMKEHRDLVEKIIKFGNAYAVGYKRKRNYGTDETLSALQIQTFEYILESEDKNEKMSKMARRLGVSKSTFSKNAKALAEKGMLERYHLVDNKKDIYLKPTQKGKEIYMTYVGFVKNICFDEMFKLADELSSDDEKKIIKLLDHFANAFIWYCINKQEQPEVLIKIKEE